MHLARLTYAWRRRAWAGRPGGATHVLQRLLEVRALQLLLRRLLVDAQDVVQGRVPELLLDAGGHGCNAHRRGGFHRGGCASFVFDFGPRLLQVPARSVTFTGKDGGWATSQHQAGTEGGRGTRDGRRHGDGPLSGAQTGGQGQATPIAIEWGKTAEGRRQWRQRGSRWLTARRRRRPLQRLPQPVVPAAGAAARWRCRCAAGGTTQTATACRQTHNGAGDATGNRGALRAQALVAPAVGPRRPSAQRPIASAA